jgi:ammonium transporter, Amt family
MRKSAKVGLALLLVCRFAIGAAAQASSTAAANPTSVTNDAQSAEIRKLELEVAAAKSSGDNAWMLTCSALVLMMTGPGLALFYGGLVRKKNVLSTMMQSFALLLRETASSADFTTSFYAASEVNLTRITPPPSRSRHSWCTS